MKTSKFWRTLFCSVMAVAAFTACSDDDDKGFSGEPTITVNGDATATVATGLDGGETPAVEVVSAGPWTLSFKTAGADTWCTPSVTSANGGTTMLKFNLGQATAAREATVILTAYGKIAGYEIKREATIVVRQNEGGTTDAETNVAEIRALLKAMNPGESKTTVTDEIAAMKITGVVVSDYNGHNFGNDYNIAVQDSEAGPNSGLTLNGNKFAELKLTPGMVVTAPLTGAQVNLYAGVLQVAISNNVDIATSDGTAPAPTVITPDKIFDYESQFVKIENCMPAEGVAGNTWGDKYNADFITTSGETFTVYSGKQAAYRTETIPDKSGYIQGIASRSNTFKRVQPRNADDLKGLDQPIPTPDYTVATIAQITKAGNYEVKDASVVALSAKSMVIADASNAFIPVYLGSTTDYAIGDKLTSVKGQVKLNGDTGPLQFSSPEVTKGGTLPYTLSDPEVFDAAKVNAWMQNPVTKYVEVSGILTVSSGKYYNLTIEGISAAYKGGSIDNPTDAQKAALDALVDKSVVIRGFAISTYSDWFTVMLGEVSAGAEPFISADSRAAFTAAGETTEISYTANNLGANKVYAKLSGTDAAQFEITAAPANGVVSVKALANTSDAVKTATLMLYIAAAENGTVISSAEVELAQSPAGVSNYVPVTAAPADWSGNYVVGYATTDKCYILKDKYSGETADKSTFTYETLETPAYDGTNIVYDPFYKTISIAKIPDTDFYSIKYGNMYVGWTTSTGNSCQFTTNAPSASTPDYQWTITLEDDGLVHMICSTKGSSDKADRAFQFNSNKNQERFAIYASTQKFVTLYKMQ